MDVLLEKAADGLNLDRSNWRLVKFGDVAIQQKESVDRENTGITRYVKGEHMNSEDLHLREWGELTDEYLGPAFIRKFEEGDILYGSRRTYLRKVVIAPFEGITSNTTFVIKANESNIDKRLLPFVMMSEGFTQHSIRNSKGSVNPYVNWKDLAGYEFLLPPKEQQAELAEMLWAMDDVVEKELVVLNSLHNTYQTRVDNLFSIRHDDWSYFSLSSEADINKRSLNVKTKPDYTFQYLDISSILEPKKIGKMHTLRFDEAPSRAKRVLDDGSIVISLVRPYQKSFVFIEKGQDIVASTGTGVVDSRGLNKKFLFHQFFSKRFIQFCENRMTGTNYPAITPNDLSKFQIAIPNDETTIELETNKLNEIDSLITRQKITLDHSKSLQKSLINQVF